MRVETDLLMKSCAFVDGENLRGVIRNLFVQGGQGVFNPHEYLPKKARWGDFFREVVARAGALAGARARWTRTYWYVIEDIDTVWLPNRANHEEVFQLLDARLGAALKFAEWLREKSADGGAVNIRPEEAAAAIQWINARARGRRAGGASRPSGAPRPPRLSGGIPPSVLKLVGEMWRRKRQKEREFRWKRERESAIENAGPIRFRRSGHIRFDPLTGALGEEKTTDVNLALDMLLLKDNYDLAVIVSGDQDFVPAVRAAQDAGKTVVNVVFLDDQGKFLPGGAKRLSAAADWSVEVSRDEFRQFLNLPEKIRHVAGA